MACVNLNKINLFALSVRGRCMAAWQIYRTVRGPIGLSEGVRGWLQHLMKLWNTAKINHKCCNVVVECAVFRSGRLAERMCGGPNVWAVVVTKAANNLYILVPSAFSCTLLCGAHRSKCVLLSLSEADACFQRYKVSICVFLSHICCSIS